jgi:hypothetical protein
MHNRQSGAAHVPMVFFILVLVMFLGAGGFAYKVNADNAEILKKNQDLTADNDALKKKDQLMDDYITSIGEVIGKFGTFDGRGDVYGGQKITNKALMNPKEVKKLIDDTLGKVGLGAASTLENAFNSMLTKVSAAEARVKDIESERDKAMAQKAEADKQFQTATTEANTKATEFATNLAQATNDFNSAKTEQESRISQVTECLRAKNDELNTEKERAAAREKELAGQVARHQMHNSALLAKETLRKAADVPDGKILVAKNGIATAFINLGRKDMLQAGTVFRVRNPNSAAVKGYATVARVEEERSEVTLSDFVDPLADYAREGDLLYNDLYTPRLTRTIYLMGRFTAPYQKENLTNLLKRLGNKVVDKMGPGVDTVILGNDPVNETGDGFAAVQDSAEYKLASELRVEFAYLNQVRDLIKL